MASPQFLYLLEQLQKTSKAPRLAWRPARLTRNCEASFRIALGEGVIRVEAENDQEWIFSASYRAKLLTRDGQLIDELQASQQFDTEHFTLLRDIFHSARAAAFNLDQLIDGMQDDIESGRERELPPEEETSSEELSSEIPF
jgi:hypothetical protein